MTSYEEALRDQTTIGHLLTDAGVPARFHGASLDSYQVAEGNEPQEAIGQWALSYAHEFDLALASGRSALFCGRTGTGKTHLAIGIARHILLKGCSARYATVHQATREIKDTWGKEATASHGSVVKKFTKPDLLVLDEVGVQFGSDTEKLILFEILNERYNEVRPTILISNLPMDGVAQFLGDRIVDRLRENGGKLLVFDWESHRGQA